MSWLGRLIPDRLKRGSADPAAQGARLEASTEQLLAEVRALRAAWEQDAEQRAEDARRRIWVELKLAALMDVLERLNAALEREERRRQARALAERQE